MAYTATWCRGSRLRFPGIVNVRIVTCISFETAELLDERLCRHPNDTTVTAISERALCVNDWNGKEVAGFADD